MKKVVVLTGAGVSAESGLKTFRDSGGLWEGYDVHEVATPQAWERNPELVLQFYNERRKQALAAKPNAGHLALAELENYFEVVVITQNVDNLHEQAGSMKVIHLHGELFKSQSTANPNDIYDIEGWELKQGDLCKNGYQLRPAVVWFGEAVPMMEAAIKEVRQATLFIVAGTSLQVYPAAGLIDYVKPEIPKFIVDPKVPPPASTLNFRIYEESAGSGLDKVSKILIAEWR